jgi:hypothetical protein
MGSVNHQNTTDKKIPKKYDTLKGRKNAKPFVLIDLTLTPGSVCNVNEPAVNRF